MPTPVLLSAHNTAIPKIFFYGRVNVIPVGNVTGIDKMYIDKPNPSLSNTGMYPHGPAMSRV